MKASALRLYLFAVAVVSAATVLAFVLHSRLAPTNLVMLYLLATMIVAMRGNRTVAIFASVLSVFCFDFFFVPPRFLFTVHDSQYLVTFVAMFLTAVIISHLTVRLREEAHAAQESEQRAVWLLEKAKKAEIDAESERMRSSLLSSVSHDFRTPLAAIVGSADTLLARKDVQQITAANELLRNIQSEGNRLTRLVQNLLQATRLEMGQVVLNKERYPLEEVVSGVIERLTPELGRHRLDVRLPEDLPLVPLDPDLLAQVFMNLLENILRHTPDQTAIAIRAEAHEKEVVVSVSDNGPGIAKADLEKLFEKFHHGSTSPGAGLGLAICRAIVQAHGGQITARNQTGSGALFQFSLPL